LRRIRIRHGLPATGPPGQAMCLTTTYGPHGLAGLGLHRWYTHLVYPQHYHQCSDWSIFYLAKKKPLLVGSEEATI
jgi:hypothetical protein